MDGRWFTVIVLLILPILGIVAAIAWFASNPLAILGALAVMIVGAFYLLTYTESFV
jgi:hypothetical protein